MSSLAHSFSLTWMRRTLAAFVMGAVCLGGGLAVAGEEPAAEQKDAKEPKTIVVSAADEAGEYAFDKIAIEEKLEAVIPEGLMFRDEDGNEVELRSLITKPTALLLVYLRCPNVCSPLMREVAHTVDEMEIEAGIDFNLITVSFDARETPQLARTGKVNLLAGMKTKIPPESWRFLTGTGENIRALSETVGFYFKRDKEDYLHDSAVIFLTKDGMVVRYLWPGKQRTKEDRNTMVPAYLPADMELAFNDARDGNARSFMQRIQSLCYAYDPEGRAYVFKVNRIILVVTLFFASIFAAVLLIKRKKNPKPAQTANKVGDEAVGGGHA